MLQPARTIRGRDGSNDPVGGVHPRVVEIFCDEIDFDTFSVHDDLHTSDHRRGEYELVWPRLRLGGVPVSDDAKHPLQAFATTVGTGRRSNG